MFTLDINVKQSVMEYGIPIEKTKQVVSEIRTLISKENFIHLSNLKLVDEKVKNKKGATKK